MLPFWQRLLATISRDACRELSCGPRLASSLQPCTSQLRCRHGRRTSSTTDVGFPQEDTPVHAVIVHAHSPSNYRDVPRSANRSVQGSCGCRQSLDPDTMLAYASQGRPDTDRHHSAGMDRAYRPGRRRHRAGLPRDVAGRSRANRLLYRSGTYPYAAIQHRQDRGAAGEQNCEQRQQRLRNRNVSLAAVRAQAREPATNVAEQIEQMACPRAGVFAIAGWIKRVHAQAPIPTGSVNHPAPTDRRCDIFHADSVVARSDPRAATFGR